MAAPLHPTEPTPTSPTMIPVAPRGGAPIVPGQPSAGGGQGGGTAGEVEFVQAQASSLWVLAHGLKRHPVVTLVDSAGDVFDADTRYIDENTILITLIAPTAGSAFIR